MQLEVVNHRYQTAMCVCHISHEAILDGSIQHNLQSMNEIVKQENFIPTEHASKGNRKKSLYVEPVRTCN